MKKILILLSALLLTACTGQVLKQSGQDFHKGDYPAALEKLMPLAEKGEPAAEYAVGYMYYYGKGVPMDKDLGEIWINKAAEQNWPAALQAQKVIAEQAKMNPLASAEGKR
jgi:TPR repeat protein